MIKVAESAVESELNEFDDPVTNILFNLIVIKTKKDSNTKKAKKQTSKTEMKKRVKLPNKLFDYIYTAQCQKLFSLAWYNDLTYTSNVNSLLKAFPELYYNGFSYNLKDLSFLKKILFSITNLAKMNEAVYK